MGAPCHLFSQQGVGKGSLLLSLMVNNTDVGVCAA